MAANSYTTSDLIADIELLGHLPLGNNTFTGAKLLRIATLELQTPIMKQILSTRGGYYLTYEDFPSTEDGLYSIPSTCVAGALHNVEIVQGPSIIQVSPIEEQEQFSTTAPTSTTYGYFWKGNTIQILPVPTIGQTRLWFIKRTGDLILTSAAAQVTAINGDVVSVSSLPTTIVTGVTVDACGDQPPFNVLGTREVINITGTDITLDQSVSDLSLGDWIAPEGQTPIPQIPVEFRILLAQRVVVKIYELQGYLDKMKAAQAKLEQYEKDTFGLITPRVSSKPKIIHAVNGGLLGGKVSLAHFPAAKDV